jgi:hypothetical protein
MIIGCRHVRRVRRDPRQLPQSTPGRAWANRRLGKRADCPRTVFARREKKRCSGWLRGNSCPRSLNQDRIGIISRTGGSSLREECHLPKRSLACALWIHKVRIQIGDGVPRKPPKRLMTPAARHVAAEFFHEPADVRVLFSVDGTPLRSVEVVMQHCSERRFDGSTDWSRGAPAPTASHHAHCAPWLRPSAVGGACWLANAALLRSACFRIRVVRLYSADCLRRQLATRFMRDIFAGANSFDETFSRTRDALSDVEKSNRVVECLRRDPR